MSTKQTFITRTLMGLSFVSAMLGCAPALVTQPTAVSVGNPIPMISVGQKGGATINVGLNTGSGFKTKAAVQLGASVITHYFVDLISDGGSLAGALYNSPTVVQGFLLAGADVSAITIGNSTGQVIPDGGTVGRFAFVNVPQGNYRLRVKASNDTTAPGAGIKDVSKPDGFFTNNGGYAISSDNAVVSNGTSTVAYNGFGSSVGALMTKVDLKETGDQVNGQINVTNGNSMVGFIDI